MLDSALAPFINYPMEKNWDPLEKKYEFHMLNHFSRICPEQSLTVIP